MAALTALRATTKSKHPSLGLMQDRAQKGSTTGFAGAMAVLNAGFAAPGTTATGLRAIGRFVQTSANPGADGAVFAQIEYGIFNWDNSTAGDLIAQADVGNICFIVDDHTVAKTSNSAARSAAGEIYRVDSDGVWVIMLPGSRVT